MCVFFYISLCKTHDPQGGAIFGSRANILTNLVEAIPNIKTLGIVVSDKKLFQCFPYTSLCKTCDPGARAFLAPVA